MGQKKASILKNPWGIKIRGAKKSIHTKKIRGELKSVGQKKASANKKARKKQILRAFPNAKHQL